jgi:hypothetical protein
MVLTPIEPGNGVMKAALGIDVGYWRQGIENARRPALFFKGLEHQFLILGGRAVGFDYGMSEAQLAAAVIAMQEAWQQTLVLHRRCL